MFDEVYDVAIIGAGPAGSTAAIYAARARLKTLLLDKAALGGALALTPRIANYPGLGFDRPLSGAELLRLMHQHAIHFGAEFVQTQVYAVDLSVEPKQIITADRVYASHTIIIATGAGARTRRLPGEEELLGRGVSYCATCDGAFFQDQEVAVVGNNEEAVTEAQVLTRYARLVHVLSPTSHLIADPEAVAALEANPRVIIRLHYPVRAILGKEAVEAVVVEQPDGQRGTIPVTGVFIYLPGNKPATAFLEGQVELDERGYIITGPDLQTSVPGVFAAGDVRGNPVQQVTLATADGTLAALAADRFLRKRPMQQR